MQKIKLNLATISYRERRMRHMVVAAAAVVVILITGATINTLLSLQHEVEAYQEKNQALKMSIMKAKGAKKGWATRLTKAQREKLKREALFIGEIVKKDVFPWNSILTSLEGAIPEGIVLQAIHSTSIKKPLILKGRARSMGEISVFLRNLENAKEFSRSSLVKFSVEPSHMIQGGAQDQDAVSFEINCLLNCEHLLKGLFARQGGAGGQKAVKGP